MLCGMNYQHGLKHSIAVGETFIEREGNLEPFENMVSW